MIGVLHVLHPHALVRQDSPTAVAIHESSLVAVRSTWFFDTVCNDDDLLHSLQNATVASAWTLSTKQQELALTGRESQLWGENPSMTSLRFSPAGLAQSAGKRCNTLVVAGSPSQCQD